MGKGTGKYILTSAWNISKIITFFKYTNSGLSVGFRIMQRMNPNILDLQMACFFAYLTDLHGSIRVNHAFVKLHFLWIWPSGISPVSAFIRVVSDNDRNVISQDCTRLFYGGYSIWWGMDGVNNFATILWVSDILNCKLR